MQPHQITPSSWTGPLTLDIRNGRDWSVGELELAVGRDTVEVRLCGRSVALLGRDRWRDWLFQVAPREAFSVDDVRWSVEAGVTCLSLGYTTYTVTGESLANLLTVI